MSCCNVNKPLKSSKEFEDLQKHFDEVSLESFEKYLLLSCKDKAPGGKKISWIAWLEIKIAKVTGNKHQQNSEVELLDEVCKKINDWVEILKNPLEEQIIEFDLFGDPVNQLELEPLPEHPTEDDKWNKYIKECERIRKSNLMKSYTFLELFDIQYNMYRGIDWRRFLPSIEEVREMYKKAIIEGKENPGRYDDFWFDTPSYLTRDGGLSDIELTTRLRHAIRLFLVPYVDYYHVYYDLSYVDHFKDHPKESKISHRYYLDGEELTTCGAHDFDTLDLSEYHYKGVFNEELIDWIRKEMKIPKSEVVSDEDILKMNLESLWDFIFGKERVEKYGTLSVFINNHNDIKSFKVAFEKIIKEENISYDHAGGSGVSLDGFCGNKEYSHKFNGSSITITQDCKLRKELGRDCDLPFDRYNEEKYVVFNLNGSSVWEKAFELLKIEENIQTSIFDFFENAA